MQCTSHQHSAWVDGLVICVDIKQSSTKDPVEAHYYVSVIYSVCHCSQVHEKSAIRQHVANHLSHSAIW